MYFYVVIKKVYQLSINMRLLSLYIVGHLWDMLNESVDILLTLYKYFYCRRFSGAIAIKFGMDEL